VKYILELGDCTVTVESVSRETCELVFSAVADALVPSSSVLDIEDLNARLGIPDLLDL